MESVNQHEAESPALKSVQGDASTNHAMHVQLSAVIGYVRIRINFALFILFYLYISFFLYIYIFFFRYKGW